MLKRRLAVLAASAMLLMSFSYPGHVTRAAHRTASFRSVQQSSRQVQFLSPFHQGGCHEQDGAAYDPADD